MKLIIFFLFSLSALNVNGQYAPRLDPYVRQLPVGAMAQVGAQKQRLYEERANWIQQEINRLFKVVEELFNENTLPSKYDAIGVRRQVWEKFTAYINSIRAIDYSDSYQFNGVRNSIGSYENWFYDSYNKLIRN